MTLQELIDGDMCLAAHCGALNCGHHRVLDLGMLIARLGPGYSSVGDDRLRNALKCTRCGHKGGSLTLSACFTSAWQREMASGSR